MQDDIEKALNPDIEKYAYAWWVRWIKVFVHHNSTSSRFVAKHAYQAGYKAHAARSGWCFDMDKAPKTTFENHNTGETAYVQGYYPDDIWCEVWTVWQDEEDNWYGDHHTSPTATHREPPKAWRHISPPQSKGSE